MNPIENLKKWANQPELDPNERQEIYQIVKICLGIVSLIIIGFILLHLNQNIVTLIKQNQQIIDLLSKK